MRVNDILLQPFADVPIAVPRIRLFQSRADGTPSRIAWQRLRMDVRAIAPRLLDMVGPVWESRVAVRGEPSVILVDSQGPNGYARLVFENTECGLTAIIKKLSGWDPLVSYQHLIHPAIGSRNVKLRASFFSEADALELTPLSGNDYISINLGIIECYLGNAFPLTGRRNEFAPELSTTIADQLLSVRAGTLLAQTATLFPIFRRGVRTNGLEGEVSPAPPTRTMPRVSSTVYEVTKPISSTGDLVHLPRSLESLDFNRLLDSSLDVLDPEVVLHAMRLSRRAMEMDASIDDIRSAMESLSSGFIRDPVSAELDPEAAAAVERYTAHELERLGSSLLVLSRAESAQEQSFVRVSTVTPQEMRRKLGTSYGPFSAALREHVKMVAGSGASLPLPRDHLIHLGRATDAPTLPPGVQPDDSLYLLNPAFVAGSIHAKLLMLAAEAAIREAAGATQHPQAELAIYLPRLREIHDEAMARAEQQLRSTLMQPDGLSSAVASYAQGYRLVSSHLDVATYRLGQTAGMTTGINAGAREAYRALRSAINFIDLPPIESMTTLDSVLGSIASAANQMNELFAGLQSVVTNLNNTITNLNDTITNLRKQIDTLTTDLKKAVERVDDLLRGWADAGHALTTLGLTGAGLLVGGPIGAGIGAGLGAALWIFG